MSDNGKGDLPRPMNIDVETYKQNHEKAFGKRKTWWERRDEAIAQQQRIEQLQQEAILKELTETSQEMGLYDEPTKE